MVQRGSGKVMVLEKQKIGLLMAWEFRARVTIPCTWMGVGMGVGVDVLYVVVFPKAATFIS